VQVPEVRPSVHFGRALIRGLFAQRRQRGRCVHNRVQQIMRTVRQLRELLFAVVPGLLHLRVRFQQFALDYVVYVDEFVIALEQLRLSCTFEIIAARRFLSSRPEHTY
jgi:hypothetical protein